MISTPRLPKRVLGEQAILDPKVPYVESNVARLTPWRLVLCDCATAINNTFEQD